jgi:hypothetical protein
MARLAYASILFALMTTVASAQAPQPVPVWDAACLYEIDLPRPRQEILQENRIIPKDEIAKKEKPSAEVEGMKKYLGL